MTVQPRLSRKQAGDAVVVTIEEREISSDATDALLALMAELGQAGNPVKLVVDMAQVRFIDSVALGALVVLLRRVKASEGRLALTGLSGHVMKVLQVTSLEKVFELYDSAEAALTGFNEPA